VFVPAIEIKNAFARLEGSEPGGLKDVHSVEGFMVVWNAPSRNMKGQALMMGLSCAVNQDHRNEKARHSPVIVAFTEFPEHLLENPPTRAVRIYPLKRLVAPEHSPGIEIIDQRQILMPLLARDLVYADMQNAADLTTIKHILDCLCRFRMHCAPRDAEELEGCPDWPELRPCRRGDDQHSCQTRFPDRPWWVFPAYATSQTPNAPGTIDEGHGQVPDRDVFQGTSQKTVVTICASSTCYTEQDRISLHLGSYDACPITESRNCSMILDFEHANDASFSMHGASPDVKQVCRHLTSEMNRPFSPAYPASNTIHCLYFRGTSLVKHAIILSALVFISVVACEEEPPSGLTQTEPDSTSQNYTWEFTTLRCQSSTGVLRDICYINDTCIWAVGEFLQLDSTSGEYYNACRWNGHEWIYEMVYSSAPDIPHLMVNDVTAVYGTRPDNIWFSLGSVFVHWDGESFTSDRSLVKELSTDWITECWGNGPDDIYMGGLNGSLVHYDGKTWKLLQSDIVWDIGAMHGNGDTVLVAATGPTYTGKTAFYTIVGGHVQFFSQDTLPHGVQGLWFDHLSNVFTCGPHSYRRNGPGWYRTDRTLRGYANDMTGQNTNDVIECGDFTTLSHFNGKRWRHWWKFPGYEYVKFFGVEMVGDRIWAVGVNSEGADGIIVTGQR
jgi:hypothetical protein